MNASRKINVHQFFCMTWINYKNLISDKVVEREDIFKNQLQAISAKCKKLENICYDRELIVVSLTCLHFLLALAYIHSTK